MKSLKRYLGEEAHKMVNNYADLCVACYHDNPMVTAKITDPKMSEQMKQRIIFKDKVDYDAISLIVNSAKRSAVVGRIASMAPYLLRKDVLNRNKSKIWNNDIFTMELWQQRSIDYKKRLDDSLEDIIKYVNNMSKKSKRTYTQRFKVAGTKVPDGMLDKIIMFFGDELIEKSDGYYFPPSDNYAYDYWTTPFEKSDWLPDQIIYQVQRKASRHCDAYSNKEEFDVNQLLIKTKVNRNMIDCDASFVREVAQSIDVKININEDRCGDKELFKLARKCKSTDQLWSICEKYAEHFKIEPGEFLAFISNETAKKCFCSKEVDGISWQFAEDCLDAFWAYIPVLKKALEKEAEAEEAGAEEAEVKKTEVELVNEESTEEGYNEEELDMCDGNAALLSAYFSF